MNQRQDYTFWLVLLVPVIWMAAMVAQSAPPSSNLVDILINLSQNLAEPFTLRWTGRTAPCILGAVLIYGMVAYTYTLETENQRKAEEHGSARWGSHHVIDRRYRDRANPFANVILTKHVAIGLDGHRHKLNINTLIVGGPGSGKSQTVMIPGILNACGCSYIAVDSKGEILRATGNHLTEQGYTIPVLDLLDMNRSYRYNPFAYLRTSADVMSLVTTFIASTTPPEAKQSDPFWEKAEVALLTALILYLIYEAPPYEQNFTTLNYMIQSAAASEDDEDFSSPLDLLFERLAVQDPAHIALSYYRVYKQGTGKTLKSILITTAVRLAPFNLPELRRLTEIDEMDLGSIGEEKTALFLVISDNDPTYNFLVAMLQKQAIKELYYRADHSPGGRLPIHVRFMNDEFASTLGQSNSDSYLNFLSTNRGRNISAATVIQNVAQLKQIFKGESWETVIGSSDILLYLGGMEPSGHKLISEMMGKATVQYMTRGITKGGSSGGSSTNYNIVGRELLTPDEVRKLDKGKAILLMRGEPPILDDKYDVTKHPYFRRTDRGGAEPYLLESTQDYRLEDTGFGDADFDGLQIIPWEG